MNRLNNKPRRDFDPNAALDRLAQGQGITRAELEAQFAAAAERFSRSPERHPSIHEMLTLGYSPDPHVQVCEWCQEFRQTLHGTEEEWAACQERRMSRHR